LSFIEIKYNILPLPQRHEDKKRRTEKGGTLSLPKWRKGEKEKRRQEAGDRKSQIQTNSK
jgi:hypothetical protein